MTGHPAGEDAVEEVPYLVVGAGPVGLTAARLLGNAGRRCLVVDRRDGPQRNPAAHVVNARTLEILRQAGFDMAAIAAIAEDPAEAGWVHFVTVLNGAVIGRLPFERQGDECLHHTPTPLRNISQHRLEPLMAAEVVCAPGVELRYDTEWLSSAQDATGVTTVLRDARTGATSTVRSDWLIGADGAGSGVRKSLGIEMVGPASIQSFVAIHLRADLRRYVRDRLGVLYFVKDPEAAGAFIAHDIDREWVFMVAFDPAVESVADYPADRCIALARRAIGDPGASLEVAGVGTWHMSAQVAERMAQGRIFLAGDAAHRFPPTGGMGLNTGVADAHGLVWRLVAVDDGWAGRGLLATYDTERRPVAATNCRQSLENAVKMVLLDAALDLRGATTSATLPAVVADPARRDEIAAAVGEQATHFDMLGLQLGYVYADGALVRDGAPPPPIADPRPFDPDGSVGSRLPHGWLADGRSTLDLVDPAGLTLLSRGDHDRWAAAVRTVDAPLAHVRLGRDVSVDDAWWSITGLRPTGALLLRPDQHIAWRGEDSGATTALGAALSVVLARPA